jgi:peptide/nickel transport system substrate-binding protein
MGLSLLGACRPHQPEPSPPDRLVALVPALPESLDPFQDTAGAGDLVFFNAYEPLMAFAPSGALEAVLAESWSSSGGGELTVRLKPNLRFQDGTPLEATHVAASLDAARKAGSRFAARLADVAEVRAGDRGAVVLRAVAGGALRPESLADIPIVKLVPGGIPGGTGPYRVTAFTAGESATLAAAEGRAARPALAQVLVRRFHSAEDVQKDILGPEPRLVVAPPHEVVALARSHEDYRVVTQPANEVIALAMDLARDPTPGVGLPTNPFRKPQVRRALRLALDREALRKALEGGGLPATQMAPPMTFGFDPLLEPSAARVDEARSLLREAGLARGFEVRLDLAQEHEGLGRAVAGQLEGVGIRVKLNPLKAPQLPDVMLYESSLALYSWTPGADPTWALRAGMRTRVLDRGPGDENWTGYSDGDVDRGIEKALSAAEPAARREALQAVFRKLAEDSAWVPLLVPNAIVVLPKGLTYPARADGRILLAEARLEAKPTPIPLGTRRRQVSENRARTGAWSDGCFPLRSFLSIPASMQRRASGSLARM